MPSFYFLMTIIRNVTKNDEPVLTQVNPRGRQSPAIWQIIMKIRRRRYYEE